MIKYILLAAAFIICYLCVPSFRLFVKNPIKTFKYLYLDIVEYFTHKKYNNYKTGEIVAYTGGFGSGKTLSVVHRVCNIYNEYNGKLVWCPRRKALYPYKVRILSNVPLYSVPYEFMVSLEQLCLICDNKDKYDDENNCVSMLIVLGDEFSVLLNCRDYKSNLNEMVLNKLKTCRHYNCSIYYTTQSFDDVDAILRRDTSIVVECDKKWRFQLLYCFNPRSLDVAKNSKILIPDSISMFFVTNADYTAYNTYEVVGNLKKQFSADNMLSEKDIIALQVNTSGDINSLTNTNKKYRKIQRSYNKR